MRLSLPQATLRFSKPFIPFGSSIRFVSSAQYMALPWYQWKTVTDFQENCIVMSRHGAKTQNILMCLAGGVQNTKLMTMYHFFPGDSMTEQIATLRKILERIQPKKSYPQGLRALFIGGESMTPESVTLCKALESLYRELRIPFSKIFGRQHSRISHVAYSVKDDTWYINTNFYENGERVDVDSFKRLTDAFDSITIDPGDTLHFGLTNT